MSIIYQHCAPRDYVLPRVTCYLCFSPSRNLPNSTCNMAPVVEQPPGSPCWQARWRPSPSLARHPPKVGEGGSTRLRSNRCQWPRRPAPSAGQTQAHDKPVPQPWPIRRGWTRRPQRANLQARIGCVWIVLDAWRLAGLLILFFRRPPR